MNKIQYNTIKYTFYVLKYVYYLYFNRHVTFKCYELYSTILEE